MVIFAIVPYLAFLVLYCITSSHFLSYLKFYTLLSLITFISSNGIYYQERMKKGRVGASNTHVNN